MQFSFSAIKHLGIGLIAAGLFASPVFAADSAIDSGDTAWILTATALVLLMTLPGLALFYAGLVQSKHRFGSDAPFCHCGTDVNFVGDCRLLACLFR